MVAGRQFGEPVMTLAEAAGWLERRFGRRPNVASIWRWATKGSKGVRLETISLGRFRYTCHSALQIQPPCGGYWTEESSCSDLLARGHDQVVGV